MAVWVKMKGIAKGSWETTHWIWSPPQGTSEPLPQLGALAGGLSAVLQALQKIGEE